MTPEQVTEAIIKIEKQVSSLATSVEGALKRIDEQAKQQNAIFEVQLTVKEIRGLLELESASHKQNVEKIANNSKRIDLALERIDAIEKRPAKWWDYAVLTIVGILAGYVINQFLK